MGVVKKYLLEVIVEVEDGNSYYDEEEWDELADDYIVTTDHDGFTARVLDDVKTALEDVTSDLTYIRPKVKIISMRDIL